MFVRTRARAAITTVSQWVKFTPKKLFLSIRAAREIRPGAGEMDCAYNIPRDRSLAAVGSSCTCCRKLRSLREDNSTRAIVWIMNIKL